MVSVAKGEGFARPIAPSIMAGRAAFLISDPVFKEFYDGCAIFYESVDDLAADLELKVQSIKQHEVMNFRANFLGKVFEIQKSFESARTVLFGL